MMQEATKVRILKMKTQEEIEKSRKLKDVTLEIEKVKTVCDSLNYPQRLIGHSRAIRPEDVRNEVEHDQQFFG